MTLSPYEQTEWDRLQKRKADALNKKARHLLPAAARDRVSKVAVAVKNTPAAERAGAAYGGAATELGKIIGGAASLTVSNESVVKQFRKVGHDISALRDVRSLDLESIDSVARLGRIRWGHSGTAALGGVVSGAAITGGTVLFAKGTIHDEGAKQAPGIGVVATAYAGDIAAVLGLAARTVASTARYYGYDPQEREEQVFMMSVIGLGMATGTSAKTAAHAELSQLTQLLFRDAAWDKLNEKVLTKVAQKFANKFSVSLTKKKFGQFVPLAGVAFGAISNFALVDKIAAAANDAYRERLLVEKAGGELNDLDDGAFNHSIVGDETISVMGILEQEDALPTQELGTPPLD